MPRPPHYAEYQDIPEIVPGVFVLPGAGVYIVDDDGEVCSWNDGEWEGDPEAVTATVNAVALAAAKGAAAVRRNIASRGAVIDQLIQETGERV